MLASSRGVCGDAGFRGRDKSRPYGQILCFRQTGRPRCLPRFAGEAHTPPRRGTRHGRPGQYGIGPYTGCLRRRGVPGTMRASSPTYLCNYARSAFSRQTRTSSTVVGADSISARFTAARGSAGGINPAPTNKFYILEQPRRPPSFLISHYLTPSPPASFATVSGGRLCRVRVRPSRALAVA